MTLFSVRPTDEFYSHAQNVRSSTAAPLPWHSHVTFTGNIIGNQEILSECMKGTDNWRVLSMWYQAQARKRKSPQTFAHLMHFLEHVFAVFDWQSYNLVKINKLYACSHLCNLRFAPCWLWSRRTTCVKEQANFLQQNLCLVLWFFWYCLVFHRNTHETARHVHLYWSSKLLASAASTGSNIDAAEGPIH